MLNNAEDNLYKILITYLFLFVPLFLFSQETEKFKVEKGNLIPSEISRDLFEADTLMLDTVDVISDVIDSIAKPIIDAPVAQWTEYRFPKPAT